MFRNRVFFSVHCLSWFTTFPVSEILKPGWTGVHDLTSMMLETALSLLYYSTYSTEELTKTCFCMPILNALMEVIHSVFQDKYQNIVRANEKLEKQVFSLKVHACSKLSLLEKDLAVDFKQNQN